MRLLDKTEQALEVIKKKKVTKYVATIALCAFAFYTLGFILKFVLYTGIGLACLYGLYRLWFSESEFDKFVAKSDNIKYRKDV